jgi:hypothetical protein
VGNTDIDAALCRLEKLTQDEALMLAAQGLKATQDFDDKAVGVVHEVQGLHNRVHDIDDTMRGIENTVKGLEEVKMNSLLDVLDSGQPESLVIDTILIFCAEAIEQIENDPISLDRT